MSLPYFPVVCHTIMINFIENILARFESCFSRKTAKQQVGAFCYRFWTKHMPRLNHYQKKDEPSPLEQVKTESSRKKVLETVRAIEMHMALSCTAMGILQILSIRFMGKVSPERLRYQRTPSRGRISEAAVMDYLRKHFFRLLNQSAELRITQIIQEQQENMPEVCEDLLAS